MDETQLFYAMQRGLPREAAIRIIVHGFFEAIMARVPIERMRRELTELVEGKLGA
jgi:Fe-S cluster assembly protein SufD